MKRKCHVRQLMTYDPRMKGLVFERKMALLREFVQELLGVYRGSAGCNTARAPDRSGFHFARGSVHIRIRSTARAPDRSGFHSARGSGV